MEPTPQPARQWLDDRELEAVLARQKATPVATPQPTPQGFFNAYPSIAPPGTPAPNPRMQKVATKQPAGSKGGGKITKKRYVNALYDLSPFITPSIMASLKGESVPTQPHEPVPIVEEVPYEEPIDAQPTIDVDQLEPMGGAQEISTEATAPAPVQGQPPAYNPRIAELAGNQAVQAASAAQFDAQNPAAAMRYAGQQPLIDYYKSLAQRPQERGKWGTFLRDAITGMPENVFGTDDSFGKQFGNAAIGGLKNSYANRETDQASVDKAGLGYAGAASEQAIYDAIMKRGQEAGQFYNPQEAGELEQMQMEMKMQLDAQDRLRRQILDEQLSGYRRNTDERAEERQDYWRDTRGQMTPNAQFAKEKWEASQRSGQSGSYKPPAVGMIDRYLGAKDSMRKLPPTIPEEVDTNGWLPFGKKTVQKPNPEYQAAKEALDYLMLIDPSLNPQGQQAQQVQQQGQLTEQDMQELEMYAQSMVANGKARNVQEAMQMIQAEAGR